MSEFRNLLAETIDRLLADHATKETAQAAEEGIWPESLWTALEENGLTRLMAREAQGGAGGTWGDALVLLRAQGRYAAPVPLAETMVAAWLLSEAGLDVPDGPLTLLSGVVLNDDATLSGTAEHVPWGRKAGTGVAMVKAADGKYQIVSAPLTSVKITEEENIAREPRDTITFDKHVVTSAPCVLTEGLDTWGALMRVGLMAGGLDYLLTQSVEYANDRKQFGKPIGKFQAVQQQLAVLATQAAAAGAIAAHACECAGESDDPGFEVAVAKTRIDEAVNLSTSISHQVHGAIGFTYEHGLHLVTRRLWSWRAEFGSGRTWAARLGRQAIERGAEALWADVTAR